MTNPAPAANHGVTSSPRIRRGRLAPGAAAWRRSRWRWGRRGRAVRRRRAAGVDPTASSGAVSVLFDGRDIFRGCLRPICRVAPEAALSRGAPPRLAGLGAAPCAWVCTPCDDGASGGLYQADSPAQLRTAVAGHRRTIIRRVAPISENDSSRRDRAAAGNPPARPIPVRDRADDRPARRQRASRRERGHQGVVLAARPAPSPASRPPAPAAAARSGPVSGSRAGVDVDAHPAGRGHVPERPGPGRR